MSRQALQKKLSKMKTKRIEAEKKLAYEMRDKLGGRLQHIYCVRVGLADPVVLGVCCVVIGVY